MRSLVLCLALVFGVVTTSSGCEDPPGYENKGGRSGFWTSRAPAKGGAYRWRLLGIGVILASVTGFGMLVLIRRASAERAKLTKPPEPPDANT